MAPPRDAMKPLAYDHTAIAQGDVRPTRGRAWARMRRVLLGVMFGSLAGCPGRVDDDGGRIDGGAPLDGGAIDDAGFAALARMRHVGGGGAAGAEMQYGAAALAVDAGVLFSFSSWVSSVAVGEPDAGGVVVQPPADATGGMIALFEPDRDVAWTLPFAGDAFGIVATSDDTFAFSGRLYGARARFAAPNGATVCILDENDGAFVASATLAGELLWAACLTGPADFSSPARTLYDVDVLDDGSLVAVGSYMGGLRRSTGAEAGVDVPTAGDGDVLVVKLAADGEALWALRFGATDVVTVRGLVVDADGTIVVAGAYNGELTTTDHNGAPWSLPAARTEIFLARIDEAGAVLALERGGGPIGFNGISGLTRLADGAFVVSASEADGASFPAGAVAGGPATTVVATYDADLQNVAALGLAVRTVSRVEADPRGGFYLLAEHGGVLSPSPGLPAIDSYGGADAYLLHFSANGAPDALAHVGSPGFDFATGLTVDAEGRAAIAISFDGEFSSDIDGFSSLFGASDAAWLRLATP